MVAATLRLFLKSQGGEDAAMQKRFLLEAQNARRLTHPNIAQVLDFDIDAEESMAYIVMEFIDGVSLQEVLRRYGTPSVGLVIEISRQCLEALVYLHQRRSQRATLPRVILRRRQLAVF